MTNDSQGCVFTGKHNYKQRNSLGVSVGWICTIDRLIRGRVFFRPNQKTWSNSLSRASNKEAWRQMNVKRKRSGCERCEFTNRNLFTNLVSRKNIQVNVVSFKTCWRNERIQSWFVLEFSTDQTSFILQIISIHNGLNPRELKVVQSNSWRAWGRTNAATGRHTFWRGSGRGWCGATSCGDWRSKQERWVACWTWWEWIMVRWSGSHVLDSNGRDPAVDSSGRDYSGQDDWRNQAAIPHETTWMWLCHSVGIQDVETCLWWGASVWPNCSGFRDGSVGEGADSGADST